MLEVLVSDHLQIGKVNVLYRKLHCSHHTAAFKISALKTKSLLTKNNFIIS